MGILLFVLKYNVYFAASEDDKWVFLTYKNHGQSLKANESQYSSLSKMALNEIIKPVWTTFRLLLYLL